MRLIDADNLLKIFGERLKVYEGEDDTKERYAYMAWLRSCHAIEDAPTIDAVEVVRCKDCKHKVITEDGEYDPEDIVCNYWMSDGLIEKDFCSYGERSEE